MDALARLIAKEEIRDLAQLYSRGVDRKDIELLKTLYTADAVDRHGRFFDGSAADYIAFLDRSLPHMHVSSHFICNHLVHVDGDRADGEVYALAWNVIPAPDGGLTHKVQGVRYIDNYVREDGRWLFAKRVVQFDYEIELPAGPADKADPLSDPSYAELRSRLFARGPRA